MKRKLYPTDLTDGEWQVLQPLLPPGSRRGRPRTVDLGEVVNALRYMVRSGCAWRCLPHDFPPWPTVQYYFRKWSKSGELERIHAQLREQERSRQGRPPTPSAASIDTQSAKTTEKGGLAATTRARRSTVASGT